MLIATESEWDFSTAYRLAQNEHLIMFSAKPTNTQFVWKFIAATHAIRMHYLHTDSF